MSSFVVYIRYDYEIFFRIYGGGGLCHFKKLELSCRYAMLVYHHCVENFQPFSHMLGTWQVGMVYCIDLLGVSFHEVDEDVRLFIIKKWFTFIQSVITLQKYVIDRCLESALINDLPLFFFDG